MKWKRFFTVCFSAAICLALPTGCSNTKAVSADLSYTQSDIGTLSVPSDVQIVGLGEASHGAKTIYAYCELQLSDNYNAARDRYMYEKTEWFLQHGDNTVLFINGHNGHIGKTSVAGYTCLGELLSESLGDRYYSIGTDARKTQFNSQMDNGEFEVVEVNA